LVKNRIVVRPSGSIGLRTIFCGTRQDALNLDYGNSDHSVGRGFKKNPIGEPVMPKTVRIAAQISKATASSEKSESHPLVSIALFSGVGLLISIVIVICRIHGIF